MAEWIAHNGRGYPFELENPDGTEKEAPTVLVRIRARARWEVEHNGEWLPATKWREWRWGRAPSSGDIVEYQKKG